MAYSEEMMPAASEKTEPKAREQMQFGSDLHVLLAILIVILSASSFMLLLLDVADNPSL